MQKLFVVLVCLSLLYIGPVQAQETVVSETNPPSLKWYKILTPHFKVMYPGGFEMQAQRMANTLEFIHDPEAETLGGRARRIPLILQNQSSVSNAFVTATPRHSEFYTMPTQNNNLVGNNDWLNLLASHEYRHVVQFQHALRGFNKWLYYLGGSNVFAGMSYAAAPQWFWEGDAVATETAFTPSGRGRIPNFDLIFRTNLQEGRTFNYSKQYLRSYKNNIPNYYVLGYSMVSYLRKKTGDAHIWENVTKRAWSVPFVPLTFSLALKKETGLYVKDLYKEMAAELQKQWKAQLDTLQLTTFEHVNQRSSDSYTDYQFPQELEDGSIVVRRSGIGEIEKLVKLQNKTEQVLYTMGQINESAMISSTNSRIVWNEYRFDPRWLVRTYSVVVGYDAGSDQLQVIGKGGRYAGAAISPDGYKIATVETNTSYQNKLVVMDYFSGKIVMDFKNEKNDFISMPHWDKEGKSIIALTTRNSKKAISFYDVTTGAIHHLTDFTDENTGYPVPHGKYVLYNSPISGIDNIYALDVSSGQRFQITCSRYGAYNPFVSKDGNTIYYNEQTRNGMDVVRIAFNPSSWKPWTRSTQPTQTFQHLVTQENNTDLFTKIPTQTLPAKRYYRGLNMLRPYSWGPTINTSLTQIYAGIQSNDLLSTTIVGAGYVYDLTEHTGSNQATISYQGYYPILDAKFSVSDRSVNEGDIIYDKVVPNPVTKVNDTIKNTISNLTFKWHETNAEIGLRLPLTLTTNRFFRNVSIYNYVGYTTVTGFKNNIDGGGRIVPDNFPQYVFRDLTDHGKLAYNHFGLTLSSLLKQSYRDINSKWGQLLYLDIYKTPYGGDYTGSQVSLYGILLFPGLAKHHSFYYYGAYQNTQIDPIYRLKSGGLNGPGLNNYIFRNGVPTPRGITVSRFENFITHAFNYTLPVWYPDIAIGPLLNVQRVRLNGFFDYGFGSSPIFSTSQSYITTGVEVKFDFNVMRLLQQFNLGFRYSYAIQPITANRFELLIGSIKL